MGIQASYECRGGLSPHRGFLIDETSDALRSRPARLRSAAGSGSAEHVPYLAALRYKDSGD